MAYVKKTAAEKKAASEQRRKARAAMYQEFVRLRLEGWTVRQIADKFGCPSSQVWNILALIELQARQQQEQKAAS